MQFELGHLYRDQNETATWRENRCAQTWAHKFDYCKMAENVFGDISENLNSESENSEVNEALDDDRIMEEVF